MDGAVVLYGYAGVFLLEVCSLALFEVPQRERVQGLRYMTGLESGLVRVLQRWIREVMSGSIPELGVAGVFAQKIAVAELGKS